MAFVPYLTFASFKVRTLMPAPEVDNLDEVNPGFIDARIAIQTSWINGRLRKRYGNNGVNATLPFGQGQPVPDVVLGWLTALVTYDAYRARGFNPQDPLGELIRADYDAAKAEVKEAADSKDGLFDLPASTEETDSSVTTGGPQAYSETSPYVWTNIEAAVGKAQDAAYTGRGSRFDE